MGFITTRSHTSGREVFACEVGKDGCKITGCKAHRCPYGWCQRYYICTQCWSLPEIKNQFTKKGGFHQSCKENVERWEIQEAERQELLNAGKFLRVAALGKEGDTIHVLFRNKDKDQIGKYMSAKTYQSYPIGTNVTVEEYEKVAGHPLLDAPSEFNHNN